MHLGFCGLPVALLFPFSLPFPSLAPSPFSSPAPDSRRGGSHRVAWAVVMARPRLLPAISALSAPTSPAYTSTCQRREPASPRPGAAAAARARAPAESTRVRPPLGEPRWRPAGPTSYRRALPPQGTCPSSLGRPPWPWPQTSSARAPARGSRKPGTQVLRPPARVRARVRRVARRGTAQIVRGPCALSLAPSFLPSSLSCFLPASHPSCAASSPAPALREDAGASRSPARARARQCRPVTRLRALSHSRLRPRSRSGWSSSCGPRARVRAEVGCHIRFEQGAPARELRVPPARGGRATAGEGAGSHCGSACAPRRAGTRGSGGTSAAGKRGAGRAAGSSAGRRVRVIGRRRGGGGPGPRAGGQAGHERVARAPRRSANRDRAEARAPAGCLPFRGGHAPRTRRRRVQQLLGAFAKARLAGQR